MAGRDPTPKRPSLEKRAFYTISELARVGNVPTYKLRRLLLRHGVDLVRSGRVYYVRVHIHPRRELIAVLEPARDPSLFVCASGGWSVRRQG